MTDSMWTRWAPVAGIIFVVLLVVGMFLITDIPNADASDEEIADYLNDGGNLTRNLIGLYIWAVAALAFLWFAAGLRSHLRRLEGESSTLSTVGFGGAVVFVAALLTSGAALAALAGGIQFGDLQENVNPDFARVMPQFGFGVLLVGGGFAAIAFVLASSLSIMQTGALPPWVAWLGFLVSIALVVAALFIPMVALPIWVLAVSVAMLMQHQGEPAGAAA